MRAHQVLVVSLNFSGEDIVGKEDSNWNDVDMEHHWLPDLKQNPWLSQPLILMWTSLSDCCSTGRIRISTLR